MAIVNIITAIIRLHPLNDAITKNIPGIVNEMVVKSFLEAVRLMSFFESIQSLSVANTIDMTHMEMYGSVEYEPFSFMSNLRTSAMYFGRSVTTTKYPTLCPICAMILEWK